MADGTFTFFFENPTTGMRIERNIRRSQATVDRIALLFKLILETVYIVEDYGDFLSEFPTGNGTFSILQTAEHGSIFKVEGDLQQDSMFSSSSSRSFSGTTYLPQGSFRRSSLPSSSRKRTLDQHALKVVLVNVANRKIGEHLRQNYFNITEATSNVAAITNLVQEFYEDRELVLVQKDLLRYEDSEATRSMSFWKNTSRKIFAVKESLLRQRSESTPRHSSTSDASWSQVMASLSGINEKLDTALSNNPLLDICNLIMKCMICQSLVTGEVAISGCCKQLVGCKSCVETWFRTHFTCPHCRSADGSETCIFVNFLVDLINRCQRLNGVAES